jgi:hypothetical protein
VVSDIRYFVVCIIRSSDAITPSKKIKHLLYLKIAATFILDWMSKITKEWGRGLPLGN